MDRLSDNEIQWLLDLVNQFDAIEHPFALHTYTVLADELKRRD